MLTCNERHLTEAERQELDQRLLRTREGIEDARFKVVVLGLFDGLVVFAGIMVCLYGDRSGPVGVCAGVAAVVAANFVLVFNALSLIADLREQRLLRQARSDDTVLVQRVEAAGVACLNGDRIAWYVFAVSAESLLAVPAAHIPISFPPDEERAAGVPVCFEIFSTSRDHLHLTTVLHGHSSLPLPPPTALRDLLPDPAARQRLETRLKAAQPFPGCLEALAESLTGRWEAGTALPADTPGPVALGEAGVGNWSWGELQARLEERFGLQLRPGQLAAELRQVEQDRSAPACAWDLLELLRRHLPAEAHEITYSLRPVFYRLRTALIEECRIERQRVRPSARLEDLVPHQRRADHWSGLSRRLGQSLPGFLASDIPASVTVVTWIGILLLYVVGVPAIQAIDAWSVGRGVAGAWWFRALGCMLVPTSCFGAIALVAGLSAYLFRNRYTLVFPAEYATVADLVRFLATTSDAFPPVAVPWTETNLWQALRVMLARARGQFPSQIDRTTRL